MTFDRFTHKLNGWLASPTAFVSAVASVFLWAGFGPVFHYSETWQLVINTSTTIITYWMAFVILNASARDTAAMQLKLDALLLANEHVSNKLVAIEEASALEIRSEAARIHQESQGSASA